MRVLQKTFFSINTISPCDFLKFDFVGHETLHWGLSDHYDNLTNSLPT